MSVIENTIVVDMQKLNLPENVYDALADFYEITNDCYKRYYPDNDWAYIEEVPIKSTLNAELQKYIVFPENDKYFFVLLRFHW